MSNLLSQISKKLTEDAIETAKQQTGAQTAVSADNMSLAVKSTLTHAHIHQHLKAADEKAEEVETQTFGLETDDGDIIKVYVAIADADEFEKELAKKLGEEDDIEEVLDQLADKFDIVDVIWPEEDEDDDAAFDDDDEVKHDIEQEKPEDDDAKAQLDDAIGDGDPTNDSEEKPKGGLDDSDSDDSEKKGGLDTADDEEDPLTDESPKKGGLKKDEDDSDEDDSDEEDPLTDDEDGDNSDDSEDESPLEDDDEDKPKKGGINKKKDSSDSKKKGGIKKESFLPLFNNMINESTDHEFSDPEMASLYREAPGRQHKLIIQALAAIGIPGNIIKLKHAAFKKNINIVAEQILQDTHIRIWLKKFVDASIEFIEPKDKEVTEDTHLLRSVVDNKERDTDEILRTQIHGKISSIAFALANKLGVDEDVVGSHRFTIKKSISAATKKITKNPRAKIALLMCAQAFGTAKDHVKHDIIHPDEHDEVKEGTILDEAEGVQDTSGLLGQTGYAEAVRKLVGILGIPDVNLQYQNAKLRQLINTKRQSLDNINTIITKINQLISLIVPPVTEDFEEDMLEKPPKEKHAASIGNDPADFGKWSISKIEDIVTLKVENFAVQLDDSEELVDDIINAIADGRVCSCKSNGKRITFRPINHGIDYIIKEFGNEEFPNGILFDQKSIDALTKIKND